MDISFWFKYFGVTIPTLMITNYLGWTSIPWVLLKISGGVLVGIWVWVLIVAALVVANEIKNK